MESAGSFGPSLPSRIDRYEVVSLLGSGSFAAVYLAHDPALDAPVAIKVLAEHHSFEHELRERFVNEARLLRRMPGERLVTVHDIGERNGQPYIVMEALPGGTFADRITGPAASEAELRHVISELGACLHALEGAGVVHRDIKPSNLLIRGSHTPGIVLSADEQLVLADFGLARSKDLSGLTVGGGTEGYVAPEQRMPTASVDHRSDLYAATAVVADVAGRRTVGGDSGAIQGDDPFAAALRAGLDADPEQRPASAMAWLRSLLAALDDDASGFIDDAADGQTAVEGDQAGERPASGAPAIRGRVGVFAAVVLAVVLVSGVAWYVNRDDDAPPVVEISEDGPQIIGPDTLLVGEPGLYLHQTNRPGVTYRWTLPSGETSTDPEIVIDPTGPGDLVLLLTANDAGVERTSQLVIDVRNQ